MADVRFGCSFCPNGQAYRGPTDIAENLREAYAGGRLGIRVDEPGTLGSYQDTAQNEIDCGDICRYTGTLKRIADVAPTLRLKRIEQPIVPLPIVTAEDVEFRIVPRIKAEASPVEREFVRLNARLFASSVDRGILGVPGVSMPIIGQLTDVFDEVSRGIERSDSDFIAEIIQPIADIINENGGHAPGNLMGSSGTSYAFVQTGDRGRFDLTIAPLEIREEE